MTKLILSFAEKDDRIRAVILNGSRTSPSATQDNFQDYDIIYIVNDVEPFVEDDQWIAYFGDLLILQKPDEIDGIWPKCKDRFAYLLLFTDWNRLDLTFLNQNLLPNMHRDSQSILLLDKDNLIKPFDVPSDKDYLPLPPTVQEFQRCCSEFFWVITNTAKGLCRKQLTYVKHISEIIVKEELIRMLTWYAGIKTGFNSCIGTFGRYLQKYVEPEIWESLCKTYVDADYEHIWEGLFEMCSLFNKIALKVSEHCHLKYDEQDYHIVCNYLKSVKQAYSSK